MLSKILDHISSFETTGGLNMKITFTGQENSDYFPNIILTTYISIKSQTFDSELDNF